MVFSFRPASHEHLNRRRTRLRDSGRCPITADFAALVGVKKQASALGLIDRVSSHRRRRRSLATGSCVVQVARQLTVCNVHGSVPFCVPSTLASLCGPHAL